MARALNRRVLLLLFTLVGVAAALLLRPPLTATATGWRPVKSITRAASLSQSLAGGRWVSVEGSNFDTRVAEVVVQTNSSGTLYQFTFEANGDYRLQWVASTRLLDLSSRSTADERGTWKVEGSTLTLTPGAQLLRYEANGRTQAERDRELSPRTYQLVDVDLETSSGERLRGVELTGAPAAWALSNAPLSLVLERL